MPYYVTRPQWVISDCRLKISWLITELALKGAQCLALLNSYASSLIASPSYIMSSLFTQQEENLQWNPSSNPVGQPANIFDFPAFEWPALEFDGSFPVEVGYSGLPLSVSSQQHSLDGIQPNDSRRAVSDLTSESQTGKQSKLLSDSAAGCSGQSAIEVRSSLICCHNAETLPTAA